MPLCKFHIARKTIDIFDNQPGLAVVPLPLKGRDHDYGFLHRVDVPCSGLKLACMSKVKTAANEKNS